MRDEAVVWLQGELVPANKARVSPSDHGLLTGDGVFETLVAYEGTPFAWDRHDARLRHSAGVLGLPVPAEGELRRAVAAVVEANGFLRGKCRLRLTVTGGPGAPGSRRGGAGPTVLVSAAAFEPWPPSADVAVVPWPRNERGALVGAKSTSYGENVVALEFARRRGAGEAIFGNTVGNLCEGTGSNIFVVFEGRLLTPPLTAGCLAGVTRAIVLELAAEAGIPCAEEDVPLAALRDVEEAFLTSTTRDVQPVARVDNVSLGDRVPGPVAATLRDRFAAVVARL